MGITMTALAYSFWIPTFWYIVVVIVLGIWARMTEEMDILRPIFIGLISTIIYIIWLIIWLCVHWGQLHGIHIINVVN